MSVLISRQYWFSAAHRLEGHPKCGRLHGHNYRVHITIIGSPDDRGMVMDYGDLDALVKPYLNEALDHKYLVSQSNVENGDPVVPVAVANEWAYLIGLPASTAEYIAQLIYEETQSRIKTLMPDTTASVLRVRVDETPKSTAVYPS